MIEVMNPLVADAELEAECELQGGVLQALMTLVADLECFRAQYSNPEFSARLETWQKLACASLFSLNRVLSSIKVDQGLTEELTSRERQIISMVAQGMVVKEIARSLAVSEKTVRNHIGSIYRKLGVYDRTQIVIYAIRERLGS